VGERPLAPPRTMFVDGRTSVARPVRPAVRPYLEGCRSGFVSRKSDRGAPLFRSDGREGGCATRAEDSFSYDGFVGFVEKEAQISKLGSLFVVLARGCLCKGLLPTMLRRVQKTACDGRHSGRHGSGRGRRVRAADSSRPSRMTEFQAGATFDCKRSDGTFLGWLVAREEVVTLRTGSSADGRQRSG
jgi:hypothetical protein